jgi:Flp pilus assembly protein TadD
MNEKQLVPAVCLSALIYISGCSGVGSDVQAGRNALQTGRANDAVAYLMRAADKEPNYRTPSRVGESVLGLLGRAYLDSGNNSDARQTLEKAVKLNPDDALAHLYLGIALVRTGEPERGRKEIAAGLRAVNDTLEYIAADRVTGFYWDPAMQIRNEIKTALGAKFDDNQLAQAAERIGREFDEEIDQARRDESRSRGGSDSSGGGS